ncbi:MAG: response regulator [Gammaproteobacteria bacterium]|nr:MAG: response regulator [Gammaproteobacteria bacterium]
MLAPEAPAAGQEAAVLLLVDDEPNILAALRRLFRRDGYRLLTASGGAEALRLLEQEAVDLIISDMRMPGMDGAALLEQVAARWPGTVRILLTGYADLGSAVAAVNRAGIHRYLSKPWDDEELRRTVREALERKRLEQERRRLERLTYRQNEQLQELNARLEEKVAERTRELERAHAALRQAYRHTVEVFASLLELRAPGEAAHARRVAALARDLARAMGLEGRAVEDVHLAGVLHDIGKIALPDALLQRPYHALEEGEREELRRHVLVGHRALMTLEPLEGAVQLVRAHHERWDGSGYPQGLRGEAIPLGARILKVADGYDAMVSGLLTGQPLGEEEACRRLREDAGRRYDPRVVEAFLAMERRPAEGPVRRLGSEALEPGMVLARDLVAKDGVLLLAKGHVLTPKLISKIRVFERLVQCRLVVEVEPGA